MVSKVKRIWMVLAALSIMVGVGTAETYHLSPEKGWQNTADIPESQYLLAVSKIKQQLLSGDQSDVVDALKELKDDFPLIYIRLRGPMWQKTHVISQRVPVALK